MFNLEAEVYRFSKMDHTPSVVVCPTTRDSVVGERVEFIKVSNYLDHTKSIVDTVDSLEVCLHYFAEILKDIVVFCQQNLAQDRL
jgi:hypothetical protein